MKYFLNYVVVRNNALKLAHKIYSEDKFVPDVIYCSMRGGAYMANVISEYYKLALKDKNPILFAAVVCHSYTGVAEANSQIVIDGWTYSPEKLKKTDKIMLVDDIFDSGRTINFLVKFLMDFGIKRENIKVVVHDYKNFTYKPQPDIVPDYFCRKFDITKPEENLWIHYLSHELVGLTEYERENYYYTQDPELKRILEPLLKE